MAFCDLADMQALAQAAMDAKAKPPGSLGLLESWAIKLSVLQNTLRPSITAAQLIVFAADHGITISAPGVSAYPRQVSAAVFHGIAQGGGASAVLCKSNDCTLQLIDVGLDADITGYSCNGDGPIVLVDCSNKIKKGSEDMLKGPAMSKQDCRIAQEIGRNAVENYIKSQNMGLDPSSLALCIGELGIGNTTSAAALVSALTGKSPEVVCGRGTGLDDAGLALKIETVTRALETNAELIADGLGDAVDAEKALQAVGGLEIAAMVGAYIRAAELNMPVIVDGFISGAAALVACTINHKVERSLFWSHQSSERGAATILEAVALMAKKEGVQSNFGQSFAALDMGLRLGEGTGAVLAIPLLRSAAAIMSEMASLQDILDKMKQGPGTDAGDNGSL